MKQTFHDPPSRCTGNVVVVVPPRWVLTRALTRAWSPVRVVEPIEYEVTSPPRLSDPMVPAARSPAQSCLAAAATLLLLPAFSSARTGSAGEPDEPPLNTPVANRTSTTTPASTTMPAAHSRPRLPPDLDPVAPGGGPNGGWPPEPEGCCP